MTFPRLVRWCRRQKWLDRRFIPFTMMSIILVALLLVLQQYPQLKVRPANGETLDLERVADTQATVIDATTDDLTVRFNSLVGRSPYVFRFDRAAVATYDQPTLVVVSLKGGQVVLAVPSNEPYSSGLSALTQEYTLTQERVVTAGHISSGVGNTLIVCSVIPGIPAAFQWSRRRFRRLRRWKAKHRKSK